MSAACLCQGEENEEEAFAVSGGTREFRESAGRFGLIHHPPPLRDGVEPMRSNAPNSQMDCSDELPPVFSETSKAKRDRGDRQQSRTGRRVSGDHGAFSLSEVFGSSLNGFTLAVSVPSASQAARRPRMRANCLSTTRCFEGLSVGSVEGAISPCRLDENAGKNTVMALTVSGHARAHAEKPNACPYRKPKSVGKRARIG